MVCRHPIDEDFNRHSFALWPVVLLVARRGLRRLLKEHWAEITDVLREEVVPDPPWQGLLWRARGKQLASCAPDTQSWKSLLEEGLMESEGQALPARLCQSRALLPLYAVAFPHRFRASLAMYLDKAVDVAIDTLV
jgi:hypothetical protein